MFVTVKGDASTQRGGSFPSIWMPIARQRTLTSRDRELDYLASTEVAVSDMVSRLPPNHRNSKLQTTLLVFGPLSQILGA